MFTSIRPMSATVGDVAEENAIKHSAPRLNFKGNPVLNWIKYSTNNNNSPAPKKHSSTNDILSQNTSKNNKENSSQPELRGVQHLRQLWNSRIGAIRDSRASRNTALSSAKSCGNLLQEDNPSPVFKKALSINNCAEIEPLNTLPKSTKDNFYKYKTAATTEKHRSASISPDLTLIHPPVNRLSFNFPMVGATSSGEKIHWMRRDNVIARQKPYDEEKIILSPDTDVKMNVRTSSQVSVASPARHEVICQLSHTPAQPFISSDINSSENNSHSSGTQDMISSNCSSNSLRSTESMTTRKKNANPNRKYSFKTQAKSYHSPRKMPYHGGNTSSNKVATLTQQFNEIIQKDRKILDEVKRNNGILISRGGHVYKVIDNSGLSMTAPTKDATLPTAKISSTVQRAIKTFESKTSDKPKVPLKSAQVLRKRKELTNKNERKIDTNSLVLPGIKEKCKESLEKSEDLKLNDNNLSSLAELNKHNNTKNSQIIENNNSNYSEKSNSDESEREDTAAVTLASKERSLDTQLIEKSKYSMIYERLRFRKYRKKEEVDLKSHEMEAMKLKIEPHSNDVIPAPEQLVISENKSVQDHHHLSSYEEKKIVDVDIMIKPVKYKTEEQPINGGALNNQSNMVSTEEILNQSSEAKIQRLDSTNDCFNTSMEFNLSFSKENDLGRTPEIVLSLDNEFKTMHDPGNNTETLVQSIAEHKILSAIKDVNRRIESLTWKTEDRFGLEYPLNESFLYQDKGKETSLTEAVNTSLVNFSKSHKTNECKFLSNEHSELSQYKTSKPIVFSNEDDALELDTKTNPSTQSLFYETFREPGACIGIEESPTTKTETSQHSMIYESIGHIKEEINSYESLANEKISSNSFNLHTNFESEVEKKSGCDYGYEQCGTLQRSPPLRPPKDSNELQRNTTDKLPELPKPKRIIPKKVFATLHTADILAQQHDSDSTVEDDNIYDTIKGGHHKYETLHSSRDKQSDSISLTSNGYESITAYRRPTTLCNAESSSTISSDHKTNSLYEVSFVNGMLSNFQNYSHSYIASSENSDDWVDISDSEANTYDRIDKKQFIVVRERMKCHRSPDWSKRVREKRLHQTMNGDDDVDHYYEPLFPIGNNKNDKTSTPHCSKGSQHAVNNLQLTEDYDSFDTDDDIYENDDSVKKNDNGLDINNVKLPNPPQSKNQVYAFVKKVKNFISNKKSPSDPNKNLADSIQGKMYENTQFQVEDNEYQSTLKPTRRAPDKPKTPKIKNKTVVDRPIRNDNSKDENIYENTDFHNPKLKTSSQLNASNSVQLSTSEKNLIAANDITFRSKSKTGKSFKSRLKSLGATGLENKNMSTLTTARSTFYVSETSNEQDSGIFEKTSSDLVEEKSKHDVVIDDKPVAAVRKNKKDVNANSYRRRTTLGIRPNDPPPPPPILSDDIKKPKQRLSTTSWYTECGVFNIDNNTSVEDCSSEKQASTLTKSTSNTSWYAEAGLYQTSGVSVASSSGSSGVSTGNEGNTSDEIGHHVFLNEPLYQIYNAEKLESISRDLEDRESTDGYEEIGGKVPDNERNKRTRPTALQLVGPKSGPSRTLWSEIPEVIISEILQTLSPRERSLQEAKFEVITSEASYLKSLNLLRSHFMNDSSFHDTAILCSRDRKTLFSYIVPVHECSEKLLSELENCWQDNIMLLGLSKSIYECAEKNFQVYVSYCEHQGKMDRALRRLKEAKSAFCQKLDELESDIICCGLTLHSFLMLPMQRITRLPLLIDAVFSKVNPNDDEYESWKLTLAILNKIVAQCNEAANRCEQAHEIERISRQLEFPSHIRALAIAPVGVAKIGSKPRFLVKKGEFVHLIWRGDDAKLTFGKKFTKSNIYAFLFSDLMVLTKRKSEEQFTVFDYCPRNMLSISSGDAIPQLPTKDASQTGKNLILMTLLENHERKTVEFVLSCTSVSEMERWLQATKPPEAETPGERLYEQWDCPQVIAKHEFIANEPDLLGLEIGDVINVSRKLPDGWFNGERIRDGAIGWFPGNFTEEVNSAHVRARNLKQRYRLLTFTATYLESQKRK